jgi:hypothetical protein
MKKPMILNREFWVMQWWLIKLGFRTLKSKETRKFLKRVV